MVWYGRPGDGLDGLDGGLDGERRVDEPVNQRLTCQAGHFRWQEHSERMAKHMMSVRRLDVNFVFVIPIDIDMGEMELTAATDVMRVRVKRRADQVQGHQQEQQPTADHRPPSGALLIDGR